MVRCYMNVDGGIVPSGGGLGGFGDFEMRGVPHLLICPPAHTGLGHEELERMRKFAGRYAT